MTGPLGERTRTEHTRRVDAVTPATLMTDNAGRQAEAWRMNHRSSPLSRLTAFVCSDSRRWLPPATNVVANISAAGTDLFAQQLRTEQNSTGKPIDGVIVLAHYDGEQLRDKHLPEGCGGAAEKKSQMIHGHEPTGDIHAAEYVARHLNHYDPTLQAYESATDIIEQTGKPVLFGVQDHRTGEIAVLGILRPNSRRDAGTAFDLLCSEQFAGYIDGEITEAAIYREGTIPTIGNLDATTEFGAIPEGFKTFLRAAHDHAAFLRSQHETLTEETALQDPSTVFLTTNTHTLESRFPSTFGLPGSAFQVTIPQADLTKDIQSVDGPLSQAHYAIAHRVAHDGQEGVSFAQNVHTVVIDTESIETSQLVAEKLQKQGWVRQWLALPGHQIILMASARNGKVTDCILAEEKPIS